MAEKTLFEKIADREIPGDFVYEDNICFAIRDINPIAPIHILIIPRKSVRSIAKIEEEDIPMVGHLFWVAKQIAVEQGLTNGYRLLFNTGPDANQIVMHLHLHLIGGRRMHWPAG
jgi:histidine triad (HIT) family protein